MPPPPVSSISTHALCAVLPASRGEDQQFILFSRRQLYVNFPLFCGFRNLSNKNPLRSYVRQMRLSLGVRPTSAGRKCRHSCMKKVFAASLDPPR